MTGMRSPAQRLVHRLTFALLWLSLMHAKLEVINERLRSTGSQAEPLHDEGSDEDSSSMAYLCQHCELLAIQLCSHGVALPGICPIVQCIDDRGPTWVAQQIRHMPLQHLQQP